MIDLAFPSSPAALEIESTEQTIERNEQILEFVADLESDPRDSLALQWKVTEGGCEDCPVNRLCLRIAKEDPDFVPGSA